LQSAGIGRRTSSAGGADQLDPAAVAIVEVDSLEDAKKVTANFRSVELACWMPKSSSVHASPFLLAVRARCVPPAELLNRAISKRN
jgi:hypothetical protein